MTVGRPEAALLEAVVRRSRAASDLWRSLPQPGLRINSALKLRLQPVRPSETSSINKHTHEIFPIQTHLLLPPVLMLKSKQKSKQIEILHPHPQIAVLPSTSGTTIGHNHPKHLSAYGSLANAQRTARRNNSILKRARSQS